VKEQVKEVVLEFSLDGQCGDSLVWGMELV
jgi:hypothetical protein